MYQGAPTQQAMQADPAPAATSGLGAAFRSTVRVLGRLLSIGVIAAAGVAGWFVADELAFGPVAGAISAVPEPNPWPEAFRRQTTTWDSFTLTSWRDGEPTHRTSTDAATGRTRITHFGEERAVTLVAEVSGLDVWQRTAGSDEWVEPDEAVARTHLELGVAGVQPRHLSTLVPRWAWPFITVTEQPGDGPHTQLLVAIDSVRLRADNPVRFERWADGLQQHAYFGDVPWLWTLDVRDDGYVVRWEGRSIDVEVWAENPADLAFESPLPPRTPRPPIVAPSEAD